MPNTIKDLWFSTIPSGGVLFVKARVGPIGVKMKGDCFDGVNI